MKNEKKILFVEDEETILHMLEQVFSDAGYVVRVAKNAEEAIEILRQESVMVMFFDLHLPGMNGIELCEEVRKQNPIGIIFALTGYVDLYSLLACRKVGFDDFFTKPVNLDVILEASRYAFEKIARWNVEGFDLM